MKKSAGFSRNVSVTFDPQKKVEENKRGGPLIGPLCRETRANVIFCTLKELDYSFLSNCKEYDHNYYFLLIMNQTEIRTVTFGRNLTKENFEMQSK